MGDDIANTPSGSISNLLYGNTIDQLHEEAPRNRMSYTRVSEYVKDFYVNEFRIPLVDDNPFMYYGHAKLVIFKLRNKAEASSLESFYIKRPLNPQIRVSALDMIIDKEGLMFIKEDLSMSRAQLRFFDKVVFYNENNTTDRKIVNREEKVAFTSNQSKKNPLRVSVWVPILIETLVEKDDFYWVHDSTNSKIILVSEKEEEGILGGIKLSNQ